MNQRISTGGIVLQEGRVLLVHHYLENEYDFWVMPGGGLKDDEGILEGAEREVKEETNLEVRAERIVYLEELIDGDRYVFKCWVLCHLEKGNISTDHKEADEGFLESAAFFSKEELQKMNVFPVILKDVFWNDLQAGFPHIRYLGYSRGEAVPTGT